MTLVLGFVGKTENAIFFRQKKCNTNTLLNIYPEAVSKKYPQALSNIWIFTNFIQYIPSITL